MLKTYTYPKYEYRRPPELDGAPGKRRPLVIVGAGPVGLTAALDARLHGIPVLLLDDDDTVSVGSRGLCYAKRALEILDRCGVGDAVVAKGVEWNVGRTFFGEGEVFSFNLLPEPDHKRPGMVNLQQYYLEQFLVERCEQRDVELRWKHKVVSVQPHPDFVELKVETPDGVYALEADWVIACDGANSDTRRMVGGDFTGQFFHDRFLIADVVMKASFPTERWFWFEPPFHPGTTGPDGRYVPSSVLLHKQADDVWRIDFQLGWDADPVEAKKPENVIPRIRQMLGPDADFELEWVSVYQFACRRMDRFRYGRVLFAGDAAHQVSPFGARGANTGVQDIDNLVWKLKLVIDGRAPIALVDSYHEERAFAADDNLLNSTRSTDFITPKTNTARLLRDAVLELARTEPFARPLVNSGRLSRPTPYVHSSLNTSDTEEFAGLMSPGTNLADAPVRDAHGREGWLLNHLGQDFVVLSFGESPAAEVRLASGVSARVIQVGKDIHDARGLLAQRLDGRPGTAYLVRPDQHVAGRWRAFDPDRIRAAMSRCLSN